MKAVIQRVKSASVSIGGKKISTISSGILTLLGIEKGDTEDQLEKLISKIIALRIFEDENTKMNKSVKDVSGSHLIVSQFTFLGDCSKGNRPSFTKNGNQHPRRAISGSHGSRAHKRRSGNIYSQFLVRRRGSFIPQLFG